MKKSNLAKRRKTKPKKRKNKPYKLDNVKKEQWLVILEKSGSFTSACRSIGMSRQAVYDELEKDKVFKTKKEDIDHLLNEVVKSRLFALTRTSPVACFYWMGNRDKKNWKNVNLIKHEVKTDKPVRFIIEDAEYPKVKKGNGSKDKR